MSIQRLALFIVAFAGIDGFPVAAGELEEIPELNRFFAQQNVTGTFVLFDTEVRQTSNAARARERFVPASTFKIPNTLIGLVIGAVKHVDEVLPYGGQPQRFKRWERDMHLRDAIKVSNVPVYRELARRVGLERMREQVRAFQYGNQEIGDAVDTFWLEGPLRISAIEQCEFLQRMLTGSLPVSAEAVAAVKEITLQEKTEAYSLHAKTGWYSSTTGGRQIGWWIGWVQRDGTTFPFALNIDIRQDEDGEKRVEIGRACLRALGKI